MGKSELKQKFDIQIKMYSYIFKSVKKELNDLSNEDIRNIATSIFIQNKDAILVNSSPQELSLSAKIKKCKSIKELEELFTQHGKEIRENTEYLKEFKAKRTQLNG